MNEELCWLYREFDEADYDFWNPEDVKCRKIRKKICAARDRAASLLHEAEIKNDETVKMKEKIYKEIARVKVMTSYEFFKYPKEDSR